MIPSYKNYEPKLAHFLDVDWHLRFYEMLFLGLSLVYIGLIYSTHLPLSPKLAALFTAKFVELLAAVYALSIIVIVYKAIRHGSAHGWTTLKQNNVWLALVQPYFTLHYLMLAIRRGFCIFGSIYFFLHLKHLVIWLNTSNYDLTFWNLDRLIHFGVQPNIFFMNLLSKYENLAVLTDWLYIKYFNYKILVSIFFLLELRGRELSERFFVAYTLLWMLGGLSYLVAPADGPCYSVLGSYSIPADARHHLFRYPVVKDIPQEYAENYQNAKIWIAKSYQEKLWSDRFEFLRGKKLPGVFYGIAAMPSLHVAAVMMIMIFLFRVSSVAGFFGAIYTVWIFIGSMFLQWHFAVDGYIGATLALFICWVSFKAKITRIQNPSKLEEMI